MSLPGAHCVVSPVNDGELACMVHTAMAPCMHDGEPANPGVIHSDAIPSRNRAIAVWQLRTHRQRTLVLHVGDSVDGSHDLGVNAVDCACGPEVLWAQFGDPGKGAA